MRLCSCNCVSNIIVLSGCSRCDACLLCGVVARACAKSQKDFSKSAVIVALFTRTRPDIFRFMSRLFLRKYSANPRPVLISFSVHYRIKTIQAKCVEEELIQGVCMKQAKRIRVAFPLPYSKVGNLHSSTVHFRMF